MALAEKTREKTANAAIAAVIAAYDIHPPKSSANAAAGLYENHAVTWSPRFGEMLTNHVYRDAKGRKIDEAHLEPGTRYLGITWADGQIVITPEVLFGQHQGHTFSAGMIAAVIYHETLHFEQLTDPMSAQHMTGAALEFAAHMAMESRQADFQLTTDEMKYISDALNKSLERNLKNPHVLMIGPVSLEPTALGTSDSDGEAAFLQGLSQLAPVTQHARDTFAAQEAAARAEWEKNPEYIAYEAHVRATTEKFEREREERERTESDFEVELRLRHEHFEEMMKRWGYLKAMAGLACSNPDAFERLSREGKVPGVSLPDRDLDWQVNKNEAARMENPCQKYLLTTLLQVDGLISGADMVELARRYRSKHPPWLRLSPQASRTSSRPSGRQRPLWGTFCPLRAMLRAMTAAATGALRRAAAESAAALPTSRVGARNSRTAVATSLE